MFSLAAVMILNLFGPMAASDSGHVELDLRICGPVAMWLLMESLDVGMPLDEIISAMPRQGRDSTFAELAAFAESRYLNCRAVEWHEVPPFTETECPAIIPITTADRRLHFISLLAAQDGAVKIQSFPNGPRWITETRLRQELGWDGSALHVARHQLDIDQLLSTKMGLLQKILIGMAIVSAIGGGFALKRKRQGDAGLVKSKRRGFTIIDVVVAMAVMALLMSLLMPAVERSREAARKVQCQNNQRQLGLAIANFSGTHGKLPNLDLVPPVTHPAGFLLSSDVSIHSLLLPYLDQSDIFRELQHQFGDLQFTATGVTSVVNTKLLSKRISVFECSSDSVPAGGNSYVLSCGTSPGLHTNTELHPPDAGLAGYVGGTHNYESLFTDGLSQTVILSERLVGDRNVARYTAAQDHAYLLAFDGFSAASAEQSCRQVSDPPTAHFSHVGTSWLAGGYGYTWYNHVLTPNSRIPDCSDHHALGQITAGCHTARSWHLGGVNTMLGDGSVRFLSEAIDMRVWRALGTSHGGEAIAAEGLK